MLRIELLLPKCEALRSDWRKCSEFGSFKHFLLLPSQNFFLFFLVLTLNQMLIDPQSSFFNDIQYNWQFKRLFDDPIDAFGDLHNAVTCYACQGLELVSEGQNRVTRLEFEGDIELIIVGIVVWFAQYAEFVRTVLVKSLELIQINVLKSQVFIALSCKTVHINHLCHGYYILVLLI